MSAMAGLIFLVLKYVELMLRPDFTICGDDVRTKDLSFPDERSNCETSRRIGFYRDYVVSPLAYHHIYLYSTYQFNCVLKLTHFFQFSDQRKNTSMQLAPDTNRTC